ncbi:MAG: DUF4007 family protein [Oscillatoriales cyanobacterium SM2_2_1]|nr:DUF4007 family protein [Oscillatoriales cyanobacterium SM2_2_1]
MSELDFSTLSLLRKEDLRLLLCSLREDTNQPNNLSARNVRNAKKWARAANLVDTKGLTELGKVVICNDPNLEAVVTDWVIHFQLSLSNHPLYNYFVYDYVKNHYQIKENNLAVSTTKAIRLLTSIYTESEALAKCKFIIKDGKGFSLGTPDLTNSCTIAYLLAEIWMRDYPDNRSLLVDDILSLTIK